jgi:small subunit ribosomal protein S1
MIDNDDLRSETKTTNGEDGMTEQKATESPGEVQPDEEEMGFQEILESSMKDLKEGEIVQGEVIQITSDNVVVDVGYKSEGRIPLSQFQDKGGTTTVQVGDSVQVFLEQWEDDDGEIVLSKDKADQLRVWEEINKVLEKDGVIEGRVSAVIKGGLSVDIGVEAFLPGSQVDLHPIRDLASLIGQTFKFKVLKFNKRRGNIVLSRRALLEKEREELRKETVLTLKEGQIVEGIIKNITDYGLFVDLGGIDGLLHITDISWGRVTNPSEMFKIGEQIKVKIISFDRENERVSLGYKQIKPDPWEEAEQKYPIGARIQGKIVNITNYGAFIELEEGIEGLIHISEMSWIKKVRHPSQLLSIGDLVEAMVLDLDVPRKRISLSLKQLEPNPWVIMEEKYPPGTVIEGKVKNITDFGIFFGFDEGIDGLVHISDISWTQKIKHPSELYKKGQEVQAVVLSIDKENERFSLGIKQLEKDPWDGIAERYNPKQKIAGTVTNVTSFGVFLELGEGIEGLIHISEMGDVKVDSCKPGEELSAVITNIDKKGRKISLSIKELTELTEKEDVTGYMETQEVATSPLGEKLKEKLEEKRLLDESLKAENSQEPPAQATEPAVESTVEASAGQDESLTSQEPEATPEEKTEEKAESVTETETVTEGAVESAPVAETEEEAEKPKE